VTAGPARRASVHALIIAIAACSRRPELASCDEDLRGVYIADGERWMVLDEGAALEAYPLFPDGDPAAGPAGPAPPPAPAGPGGDSPGPKEDLVVAPRVIDLERAPGASRTPEMHSLRGTVKRRYMRRAERCEAKLAVHVTRCAGDTLELVLSDPSPPIAFSPCTWPGPSPSRVVRWRRE
jgi:hypothetical protein